MTTNLTLEQKKSICIAYLASGNSVHALCEQLITTLHKATTEAESFEQFFEEIHKDSIEQRKQSPESFDTTADEEMNALLEIAREHEYEYGSQAWG